MSFSVFLFFGLVVFANAVWQPPVQPPPGGQPAAPIDESGVGQKKEGYLTLRDKLTVGGQFFVGKLTDKDEPDTTVPGFMFRPDSKTAYFGPNYTGAIRYKLGDNKLQFSNDGSVWQDF